MLLDTPLCNFGWKAPQFTLSDADGVSYSMSEQIGEKGLLIAFICNHCPYVVAVAERFSHDADELIANGINVLAIMANDYRAYPADSPENMKRFARDYDFKFPYLIDESQDVARAYDAVCTPDFFGLNALGELQYRGRIDNARMGDPTGRSRELFDGMMQVAATGDGPQTQYPSAGCSIKWRG